LSVRTASGIPTVMQTSVEKLVAKALGLPAEARAFVAEKLIESLDSEPSAELTAEWKEEVRKRCREVDDGRVELRDAQAVFDRAYSAF